MKKALSVFLAILMLFGALSVGASAVDLQDKWHAAGLVKPDEAALVFNLNGGTLTGVYVWNEKTNVKEFKETYAEAQYVMVPQWEGQLKEGCEIVLPYVTPPSGATFVGWYCEGDGKTYAPASYIVPANTAGKVVNFTARYRAAATEVDTMTKVIGILTKVFGAIIGILMYGGDTAAGVALVKKILGGVIAN